MTGIKGYISCILCVCVALLFAGCSETRNPEAPVIMEDFALDDTSVQEVDGRKTISINDHLFLSVREPQQFLSFQWELFVKDDIVDEELKVGQCVPRDGSELNKSRVECIFAQPGRTRIQLTTENIDGDVLAVAYEIDVLGSTVIGDQDPVIVLDLRLDSEDDPLATISTSEGFETEGKKPLVEETVNLIFDFSRTTDDNDELKDLRIEIKVGDEVFTPAELISERAFETVGDYLIQLRVSDSNDNVAEKEFILAVTCLEGAFPDLQLDTDTLTVDADSVLNYFFYKVGDGSITGGKGPYQYMWDFNGDSAFDTDWTSEQTIRAYTIYARMRSVALKVEDIGCNKEVLVNLGELEPEREFFEIPLADGIPGTLQGPQISGHHFIQGIGVYHEDYGQRYEKEAMNITHPFGATSDQPRRVICDYRKVASDTSEEAGSDRASLRIKGLNQYDKGYLKEAGRDHGLMLLIENIDDATGVLADLTVERTFEATTAELTALNYYTDGEGDAIQNHTYQKQAACQVSLFVTVIPEGSGTCADSPDTAYSVLLDGTYSCPDLKAGNDYHMLIEQGAFYCEVAQVDACPPGGGGGGGGLPPIPE